MDSKETKAPAAAARRRFGSKRERPPAKMRKRKKEERENAIEPAGRRPRSKISPPHHYRRGSAAPDVGKKTFHPTAAATSSGREKETFGRQSRIGPVLASLGFPRTGGAHSSECGSVRSLVAVAGERCFSRSSAQRRLGSNFVACACSFFIRPPPPTSFSSSNKRCASLSLRFPSPSPPRSPHAADDTDRKPSRLPFAPRSRWHELSHVLHTTSRVEELHETPAVRASCQQAAENVPSQQERQQDERESEPRRGGGEAAGFFVTHYYFCFFSSLAAHVFSFLFRVSPLRHSGEAALPFAGSFFRWPSLVDLSSLSPQRRPREPSTSYCSLGLTQPRIDVPCSTHTRLAGGGGVSVGSPHRCLVSSPSSPLSNKRHPRIYFPSRGASDAS
ncbi:hypothetical protein HPB50_004180 [Hyalomma asiaticum]|uniref:Uncharacterized protein n=1 Tax=Hyalomma asiaticum TaxID=266040 RepID=A0ACB7T8A9_HYAAI|nr:hypothetical protein HPB50_004180 [Hyalomma asiaticum]